MEWTKAKDSCAPGCTITESKDGRFYIVGKNTYVSLHDTRNPAAGGMTCDSVADAKEMAEKIVARPDERPSMNFKREGKSAQRDRTFAAAQRHAARSKLKLLSAVVVNGDTVEFEQNGVTASLKCDGAQHAAIIARALIDGLIKITTRCE